MLKVSQFTVVKDLSERGAIDQFLVYNTASHRCLLMPRSKWETMVTNMDVGEPSKEVSQALERMEALGIFVHKGIDEQNRWLTNFNAIRYGQKSIFPLLAVTTGCNIGCTYCYEAGITAQTMSNEIVAHCIDWMERRILEDGVTNISPGLFGGEPLLYPKILFALMNGHKDLCNKYGINGTFYTSSNGMLLTDEMAKNLAEKGLTQIQISLDGPEPIHDIRRITKRGSSTYAGSLRGLQIAARHIESVTLKVNFDRQNVNDIEELLDAVVKDPELDGIPVKLEAIAHQMEGSKVAHTPDFVIPPESDEMADAYAMLTVACKERGLKVTDDTAHTTPCMLSSHHGVIIGPAGNIYKCISLVGRREHAVGTVFEERYYQAEYDRQMDTRKKIQDCFKENCPYIPVCAGGCAFESAIRGHAINVRYCTKEFLDRHHYLRHLIKHSDKLKKVDMTPLSVAELRKAKMGGACGSCENKAP